MTIMRNQGGGSSAVMTSLSSQEFKHLMTEAEWQRNEVSILDFLSPTDTDIMTALAAAEAAVFSLGGGTIRFPARAAPYLLVAPYEITHTGIRWLGDGVGSVISSNFDGDILQIGDSISNVGAVEVRDLAFTSSVTRTYGATIKVANGHHVVLGGLAFIQNQFICIDLLGGGQQFMYHISDIRNYSGVIGIRVGGNSLPVADVWVRDSVLSGFSDSGLSLQNASGVLLRDIDIIACGVSLKVNPTSMSAAVTISVASPAVVTWPDHGLLPDAPITFSTSGALPPGLVAGTIYYVLPSGLTADTFSVASSARGAPVITTGVQSGTHTALFKQNVVSVYASQVYCDTATYEGLLIAPTGAATVSACSFTSLWTATCGQSNGYPGLRITAPGALSALGLKFVNLRSINNGGDGVRIENGMSIDLDGQVTENGLYNPGTYSGVYISAGLSHFDVRVRSTYGTGFGTLNPQAWAVYLAAGASDFYSITGDCAHNSNAAGIYDGGTGSRKIVDPLGGTRVSHTLNEKHFVDDTDASGVVIVGKSEPALIYGPTGPGALQISVGDGVNTDEGLRIGVDTTLRSSWVQAARPGYWASLLQLQPCGGAMTVGSFPSAIPRTALTVAGPIGLSAPVTITDTSYLMVDHDSSLVFTGTGDSVVGLPPATDYTGRIIFMKTTVAHAVASSSANVIPLAGGAAGTAILAPTAGKWATLQSDGANWHIMSGN